VIFRSKERENRSSPARLHSCALLFSPDAFLGMGVREKERWHSRRCMHPVACAVTVAWPVMLFSLLTGGRERERGRERGKGKSETGTEGGGWRVRYSNLGWKRQNNNCRSSEWAEKERKKEIRANDSKTGGER